MEKEKINEDKAPKKNLIDLTIFFESLNFLIDITPEDKSINNDHLLDEIKALEPEFHQILVEFLSELRGNPLIPMFFILKEDENEARRAVKERAKINKKSIYQNIIYEQNLTPSSEEPLASLQNDMNDLSILINELFLHNNAIADPKKVFYLHVVVSTIINKLTSFHPNPLLLLSEQASYYINSNVLQAIIKSLSEEEKYASELQMLKDSDQLRDKILSIIINKDKTCLESLIDQSSEDVVITIDAILNMAIQYGAHFMAKFALEQWRLYFKTHDLSEQSYRELVSLVGHALIRSNTQICLLLTQPEMWTLYREEDQLRLLELVIYRTGNKNDKSTRKILISNMKANGFLNLELYQKIPAKTEHQRKIIKAILDEYHAEILAEEAASELCKLEEEEKKETENKKEKKSKKKSKEIKDPVKIDKHTEQEKDVQVNISTITSITTQDNSPVIQKEFLLDKPKEKAKRKRKKPTQKEIVTQEIDLIFGNFTGKEEEELTSFNSSTPAQKIKSPDLPLREVTGMIDTFRYVIALNPSGKVYIKSFVPESNSGILPEQDTGTVHGFRYKTTQNPYTGELSVEYFDPLSGSRIVPEPGWNKLEAKENAATASTETNKAGETKADLAGGKKLAADNNSQSSYSLTAKVVVEFNLSLSSSLIYEEVKNTEQDEYKESIEQVEQRSEDQSANIQFENITTEQEDSLFGNLHNNSFIPLLPSDKQEFSLPFLIIGDPLEAGKVLGMIEYHNDLGNIMI